MEIDYKEVLSELRRKLSLYITSSELKSLVVGISGGVDSALTAAIAKPVCDSLGVPLIGLWLEMGVEDGDERHRAIKVGEMFCTMFLADNFSVEYNGLLTTQEQPEVNYYVSDSPYLPKELEEEKNHRLKEIRARMRMIFLSNMARRFGGATLDTNSKTGHELGLWVINGDGFDISMLSRLWKSEVYELAKYVNKTEFYAGSPLDECIEKTSSSVYYDVQQFGCENYEEVDGILRPIIEAEAEGKKMDSILEGLCVKYDCDRVRMVYRAHRKTTFKRRVPICL